MKFFGLCTNAALLGGAAFIFSAVVSAQAPIIDASERVTNDNRGYSQSSANPPAQAVAAQPQDTAGVGQGELFYQLQLLQQEVMQLRGQVEEQAYQLQQLRDQSMERYIDLDRRIGTVSAGTAPSASATQQNSLPIAQPVSVAAKPGEKEAYDKAYALVINKQFDDALAAFKQFLADFPDGSYAGNSYYWMGELYQVITPADLDAARGAFSQLLSRYPDHAKTPDAMYKLGKVYFLLGNKAAAKEWLDKTVATYSTGSNSSAADKARQFLNANF